MTVRGADYERKKNDAYQTPPAAVLPLLVTIPFNRKVCDPCSGAGNILKVLKARGHLVGGGDIERGYDFLNHKFRWPGYDVVTNPPFGGRSGKTAVAFVRRAIEVTAPEGSVAMLLPVDFDSGATRQSIFGMCPFFSAKIVLLNRIRWFRNQSGSINHAWYIWKHRREPSPPVILYAKQEFDS